MIDGVVGGRLLGRAVFIPDSRMKASEETKAFLFQAFGKSRVDPLPALPHPPISFPRPPPINLVSSRLIR